MTKLKKACRKRFDLIHTGSLRHYYYLYTVVFCITAFFCFSWFVFSDSSFIWHIDGWMQHYKALVYYARYLKTIFRHLAVDHKLVIPDWDFCIGEGSDIVNALHYYVIGDPLTLLACLFPIKFMHYVYSALSLLRLYLSGISFSVLCFSTGKKNRIGVLAGALSYSFCAWGLLGVSRHPYFVNPMILFPLMILGIEKIIHKKRPYLFIGITAVSAASNFYFFYMIVVLTVLYTVCRLVVKFGKNVKKIFAFLFTIGGYSFLGVGISAIILLPVLTMFLHDSRLSVSQPIHWFYPLYYYSQLPAVFMTNRGSYWLYIGLSAPVIISLFLLFLQKKEDRFLKILFLAGMVIICIPIGGRILNGMSYMTNRWIWAFSLLCTYILTCKWEIIVSITESLWRKLLLYVCFLFVICMLFNQSRNPAALSAVSIIICAVISMKYIQKQSIRQIVMTGFVILSAVNIAFWQYSPGGDNFISQVKENRFIEEEFTNNEAEIVKSNAEDGFQRYSGRNLTQNANMISGVSNTQYYWTISNPYVNKFRSEMAMREDLFYNYEGYDDRTTPITLSAVNYYILQGSGDESASCPFGFDYLGTYNANDDINKKTAEMLKELNEVQLTKVQESKIVSALDNPYSLYKNRYALPLGYCYDKVIDESIWENLDPVQKQEIQLAAAYISDVPAEIEKYRQPVSEYTVPYKIKSMDLDVFKTENGFITTANGAKIILSIDKSRGNMETYLGIEGLKYLATPEYNLYFGNKYVDPEDVYNKVTWDLLSFSKKRAIREEKINWNPVVNIDITVRSDAGVEKTISYKQPDAATSSGRQDFIANLGYNNESGPVEIVITLPKRGVYTIDKLCVYQVPMDQYSKKIEHLKKYTLNKMELGTDTIQGHIEVNAPKVLCMAVPYSPGWKARVDDIDTQVLCVNDRYMGVVVPKGDHQIRFYYQLPFKKTGFCISILSLMSMILIIIAFEKVRVHEK